MRQPIPLLPALAALLAAPALAQESADSMREILNELMQAVPQYAWPEITEDGDIILRRVPPGERRPAEPPEDDDIDET